MIGIMMDVEMLGDIAIHMMNDRRSFYKSLKLATNLYSMIDFCVS